MNELVEWITKHKKITVLGVLMLIFLPIIVIHVLFKVDAVCDFCIAEWNAGELLGYFGDVLAFIGTVVLGIIAIFQTQKANNIAESLMELDLAKSKPCLDFVNMQKYFMTMCGDFNKYEIENENNGALILDLLYTKNPRTGTTTDVGCITFDVLNSGHSDIRQVYVNKIRFYLDALGGHNQNDVIPMCSRS